VQLLAVRLGAELRRRRREAGLEQRELADRIGYHRTSLSHVERGREVPAEAFIASCDRQLGAEGALLGIFRAAASRAG
jgi:transcriptional regulator with XRE-family HTH domain